MDFQKMLNNQLAANRAEVLKNSPQLLLGELILKLEAVKNKELPVVFDDGQYLPTGLSSWRGSYCELAIQYKDGGSSCYKQPAAKCQKDEFGYHDYKCPCGGSKAFDTTLPEKPNVNDFLLILKLALGKYFVG